jgi:hypothetical protein
MSTLISVQEYHRLKSYYPRKTYREQETRVPHVCFTRYWKTSPHLGYRCNDCIEVRKIITFENHMEDRFQNRLHNLIKCDCHWCKNRLHLNHDNCELCTDHQEKVIIDLDEEDELFINNQSDIWEEEKDKNHCPEQEEDTQSDDGSIIIITMAELEEEKRKI